MNFYYKIIHGFNPEDYIGIEESEVEKAYGAFLQKKDAVFSGGAIKAGLIQMIKPDFHKTMGWNRGHKLDEYDFAELSEKGIDRKMEHFLSTKEEKIRYLISTKQEHLIGKNLDMPELNTPKAKEISEFSKELSNKFKI